MRRDLLKAWLKWLACLSLTVMTGPISIKPWHDASIELWKTPRPKNVMGAPCLGSCRTMSSSCFLFYFNVIMCACVLAFKWLQYWVIWNQLETERWCNLYEKALFLNFADSTNETLGLTFDHIKYTHTKSSVQKEDNRRFSTNHV